MCSMLHLSLPDPVVTLCKVPAPPYGDISILYALTVAVVALGVNDIDLKEPSGTAL